MTQYAGKLEIIGQDWEIFTADSHDPELIADGRSCNGTTWYGHFKIFLSNELRGSRLLRTIKHELTHAVIYSSQCDIPEAFSEEQVCEIMAIYGELIMKAAEMIYGTVKNNCPSNCPTNCP